MNPSTIHFAVWIGSLCKCATSLLRLALHTPFFSCEWPNTNVNTEWECCDAACFSRKCLHLIKIVNEHREHIKSTRFASGGGCFASIVVTSLAKQFQLICINARARVVSRVLRTKNVWIFRKTCVCVRLKSIFVFDSEIADAISIDKHIIDEIIELRSIGYDGGCLMAVAAAHSFSIIRLLHDATLLRRDKWMRQRRMFEYIYLLLQFIRKRIFWFCI